ncbi:hypothetical protein PBY51_014872 [Eleginops maclovinus]|uniref:Uncharacterized protein n=1 Tax=Eleginops maclovinus TaxID=56733 RepID=A0AAN7WX96_ELEMC|nr:hypothetical protein PBY51_014872 [Eleginops maclovinus]
MGERDTVWQEPGYDGICNYAQRITSCFGLDGKSGSKTEEEKRGGGGVVHPNVKQDAEAMKMMRVNFMCDADFAAGRKSSVVVFACIG